MSEGLSEPDGNESKELQAKAQQWIFERGPVAKWRNRVAGDFIAITMGAGLYAGDEKEWPKILKVQTVEEYVHQEVFADKKIEHPQELTKAIIEMISKEEFLVKADVIIAEINRLIGDGVSTKKQADAIEEQVKVYEELLIGKNTSIEG